MKVLEVPGGIADSLFQIAQGVCKNVTDQKNNLDDVIAALKAPSSYSKHRGKGSWTEMKFDNIVCHRYENSSQPVPLTLLCPVFGQFLLNLVSVDVTEEDCLGAMNLLENMCRSFRDESYREDEFHNWFYNTFGLTLTKAELDGSTNDGCIQFIDSPLLSVILEVKNEKGDGGGDPYMQAICYYLKQLKRFKVYNNGELPTFEAPCLLLELCGNSFGVSGIVNLPDCVVCEPLTNLIPLLRDLGFASNLFVARLIASMKVCIRDLQNLSGKFPDLTSFPAYFEFEIPSGKIILNYEERIDDSMVFKATDIRGGAYAVKFVEKPYGFEAHELAMTMKFAPSLITCARAPPYFLAIVMEWIDCRDIEALDFPIILPQIEEFVKGFHGRGMVHGDLRRNNLKVTLDGKRLIVLDFDWSGKEGIVRYPPFMNTAIAWPARAKTGQFISKEHDIFWIRNQFYAGGKEKLCI